MYDGTAGSFIETQSKMQKLVESFPVLRERARWHGVDDIGFKRQMKGMSTSELHCANFVLMVWNRFDNKKFNLGEAAAKLDVENIEPIIEWLKNPWFM